MHSSLRKLTVLGIFVGFLLTLAASLLLAPSPAYASGVGSGGAGGGGGGGGSGDDCSAYNTKWEFTHGKVPATGSGCTNDTLTGSSCHTSANVGSWLFYVTATADSNEGKHISLPTSSVGFGYMKNTLTGQIESTNNINAGFTSYGNSNFNNASTRKSVMVEAESVISDGKYGKGKSAEWKEVNSSNDHGANYKASNGKSLTYVCVWIDIHDGVCSGACGSIHLQQYCDDYGVTSKTYVIQKGTDVTKIKASSAADALAQCALHCPTSTSSDPSNISQYLTHAGQAIQAKYDTAAKQGNICFSRAAASSTQTQTRNYKSGATADGTPYPYYWTTIVNGDDAANGQRTHPGPQKYSYQDEDTETPFGTYVDGLDDDDCPTPAALSSAAAKNTGAAHSTVDLSDGSDDPSSDNQTAEAQGGILDVSEATTYVSVSTTKTTVQPQKSTRTVTVSYSFTLANTGAEYGVGAYASGYPKTTNGAYSAWVNNGSAKTGCASGDDATTPEQTGFYQVFTNHCDATDYNSHTDGNTVVDTGDDGHALDGTVITPRVTNGSSQTLGYGAGDRSGEFDKVCSYAGVRDSTGGDGTGNNDANDDGSVQDGASAAPATVTYFRDNEPHPFTVDHYTPVEVDDSKGNALLDPDPDDPAVATIVSTWSGGTPQAPGVSNSGQFQLFAGDATDDDGGDPDDPTQASFSLLSGASTAVPRVTDWMDFGSGDAAYFSNRTLGIAAGDYDTFSAAADWPTTPGKPEVLTVKWVYAPDVNTTAPVTVGFSSSSGRKYTLGTVDANVYGEVYEEQGDGSSTSPALASRLEANTGSAPTSKRSAPVNGLDGVLAFGTAVGTDGTWTQDPAIYSSYYHVVKFLRAVGA